MKENEICVIWNGEVNAILYLTYAVAPIPDELKSTPPFLTYVPLIEKLLTTGVAPPV